MMMTDLAEMLRKYGARVVLLSLAMLAAGKGTELNYREPVKAAAWRTMSKRLRELSASLPGNL